ncbi:MAG TPA: universal stress protein [Actinomycetota bacterium]|nr:universal stress protein [Actinomycetota bacterium]
MGVITRDRGTDVSVGRGDPGRPVLLATLGVPLDEEAAVFAVDTAVESGQRLVMANVTALEPLRMSIALGYDALPELTPEVSASLRRSAELARSLGVHVERVRVRSPRPVQALVELVVDVRPGLLVFGLDRGVLRRRRYRRALEAVRNQVTCLLWIPGDAYAAG